MAKTSMKCHGQVSVQDFKEIVESTVIPGLLHIFKLMCAFHPGNDFMQTIDKKFLILVFQNSSRKFIECALEKYELNYRLHPHHMGTKVLQLSVERGLYTTVEMLLKSRNLWKTIEVPTNSTKELISSCIRHTMYCFDESVIDAKLEICRRLLAINPKLLEGGRTSPLVTSGVHWKVLLFLIRSGANLGARDSKGSTIVHLLCENWESSLPVFDAIPGNVMKTLVNSLDNDGMTPLMRLATTRRKFIDGTSNIREDVLKILKSSGADFHCIDREGNSLLANAIMHEGSLDLFLGLVKFGSDINWRNEIGETLLHIAVNYQNFDMVKLLVNHFALDVNTKDNKGFTPLEASTVSLKHHPFFLDYNTFVQICEFLHERGAKISETWLPKICTQKYFRILWRIRCLLDNEMIDVNAQDEEGNSALHNLFPLEPITG